MYEFSVSIPEDKLNEFINENTLLFNRVKYDADKYQQIWSVLNQISMAVGIAKREERLNGQS